MSPYRIADSDADVQRRIAVRLHEAREALFLVRVQERIEWRRTGVRWAP